MHFFSVFLHLILIYLHFFLFFFGFSRLFPSFSANNAPQEETNLDRRHDQAQGLQEAQEDSWIWRADIR